MQTRCILLLLSLLLCSCQSVEPPRAPWQEISGRDRVAEEGVIRRFPIYRARVPDGWQREDPPPNECNSDTTVPICTFFVDDIEIVVHNFPSDSIELRIPPGAQIARWKGQMAGSNDTVVVPQSHGGFAGLYLAASRDTQGVLAWAMQLAPEHYNTLSYLGKNEDERRFFWEMRSDYTIKATGPAVQLAEQRQVIERFARSFELIQTIPSP